MLHTARSYRGMVTAPHNQAARAGLRVLEEGGNAIEAMIAAASTIAVVYPHMNALGGDNFWLISEPGRDVVGIDACGAVAGLADVDFYRAAGHQAIPSRGALAALTMGGAVSGWQEALAVSEVGAGNCRSLDCWKRRAFWRATASPCRALWRTIWRASARNSKALPASPTITWLGVKH